MLELGWVADAVDEVHMAIANPEGDGRENVPVSVMSTPGSPLISRTSKSAPKPDTAAMSCAGDGVSTIELTEGSVGDHAARVEVADSIGGKNLGEGFDVPIAARGGEALLRLRDVAPDRSAAGRPSARPGCDAERAWRVDDKPAPSVRQWCRSPRMGARTRRAG